MKIKRYSELIRLSTYEDRFKYLSLLGSVGTDTFGFDRYLNQNFYRSAEWKRTRDIVISRDYGCDMALDDFPITGKIIIHHMNPICPDDIFDSTDFLLNPEYLICVSQETHNAIHYGAEPIKREAFVERRPGDTKLW